MFLNRNIFSKLAPNLSSGLNYSITQFLIWFYGTSIEKISEFHNYSLNLISWRINTIQLMEFDVSFHLVFWLFFQMQYWLRYGDIEKSPWWNFLNVFMKHPILFDGISINGMNNIVADLGITGIDRSRKNPGNQHHLLTPGMRFLDFSVPVFVW